MDPMQQMAMGYAPMASGYAPQYRFGMEGAPFISKHPIVGMLASPLLMNMMGGMNMTPMGLGHDQNTWDILKHREFNAMQRAAMAEASAMDRQNFMRTFRGVAAMSGQQFGASQRRAAGTLADAAMFAAPMMAQMAPELLDQLGGMRGSAIVMANRMMDAGRYRMDPVTGRMGMSGETVGQQSRELFDRLYGDNANIGAMKGITAGQAGSMFQELQMRGMVGQDTRSMRMRTDEVLRGLSPTQLQEAAGRQKIAIPAGGADKLTAEDIDKLSVDPMVSEKLRSIDTNRIARSIKNYAGAVSAMRDIFGDMGRPNAPMSELMRNLEALTGGNLAQMDAGRAGMIARQTYNLARTTGVSMDNAMAIQGHAAQRAAAMGIESQFGVSATQGALAFGGAYRARGEGAVTSWGAMNADQLTQLDANLRVAASGSNMANRLGTAIRVSEAAGGFQKGTEAANLINALRSGSKQYVGADGKVKSVAMSEQELTSILTGATGEGGRNLGITASDVREMFTQQSTNREYVDKYNLGQTIRGLQGEKQVMPFIADRLHETMVSRLTDAGVNAKEAKEAMKAVSEKTTSELFKMRTEDFHDPQKFRAKFQEIMEEQLAGTTAGAAIGKMSAEQREQFYGVAAERFKGRANLALRSSGFAAFGDIGNVQRIFNPETLAASERTQQQAAFEGQIQDALAPLGRGTSLQRAMQFLQNAKSTDKPSELIATAFGGVKNDDLNRALIEPLQKLNDKRAALEKLQTSVLGMPDGEEKQNKLSEIANMLKEIKGEAADLAKTSQTFGFYGEEALSARDVFEANKAGAATNRSIAETGSIRGGFGRQVTPEDIAAMKASYGTPGAKTSAREAAAVIIARRQAEIRRMTDDPNAISKERIEAVKKGAKEGQGLDISDAQARDAIIKNQIAMWSTPGTKSLGWISDREVQEEMKSGKITTDEEARAAIIAGRENTPLQPSRAAVEDLIAKGMSPVDAESLAAARQRAKRWGITSNVEKMRAEAKAAGKEAEFDERNAIATVVEQHERALFNVSEEHITQEVDKAVAGGLKKEDVSREKIKENIIAARFKERAGRFEQFWRSEDGQLYRDNVMQRADQVQTIAEKLVMSQDTAKRFGTRGVEMHERLNAIAQRRRELALQYAKGDVSRLMLMDLGGNVSAETYFSVRDQLSGLHAEEQAIIGSIKDTMGKAGRQFWMGDEAAAKVAVGPKQPTESDDDYKKRVTAEQEKMGNVEEARRLMGLDEAGAARLLKGEGLSPIEMAQKMALGQRIQEVGAARKMTSDDEKQIAAFGKQDEGLQALAKKHGVTKEQLLAEVVEGKGTRKSLTALSAEESERRGAVASKYGKAAEAVRMTGFQLADAKRELEATNKKLDGTNLSVDARAAAERYRTSLMERIGVYEKRIAGDKETMTQAEKSVADDAKARNVTPAEYLSGAGKGFLSGAERDRIIAEAASQGKSQKELEALATRLGVPPDRLPDVIKNVIEPQMKKAEEKKREATASGQTLLKEQGKVFGLADEKLAGREAEELATKMGATTPSRAWSQYITATEATLKNAAKGKFGDDVGKLGAAYTAAMGAKTGDERDKAIKQLQVDLGIDASTEHGRREWDKVSGALSFQSKTGLLERKDGKITLEQLGKAYQNIEQGGEKVPPTEAGKGGQKWDNVHFTGTLKIDGNRGDLNGSSGGVPTNSVPPR